MQKVGKLLVILASLSALALPAEGFACMGPACGPSGAFSLQLRLSIMGGGMHSQPMPMPQQPYGPPVGPLYGGVQGGFQAQGYGQFGQQRGGCHHQRCRGRSRCGSRARHGGFRFAMSVGGGGRGRCGGGGGGGFALSIRAGGSFGGGGGGFGCRRGRC